MRCYNHELEDAVGICKNCGKAVCRQCLVANPYDFVVCSQKCLEEVHLYQVMMDKGKMAYGLKPGRLPVQIIIFLLSGSFFGLVGFLTLLGGDMWGVVVMGVGLIFILGALLSWINQRKSGLKI